MLVMSERIEKLVAELMLDEKAALAAGVDLWHGPGADRLGVPALKVTDGPSGARGEQWSGRPSANFPCGTALGATWNPELVHEVGKRLGIEAKRKNAHALLAPTVNIHRHPLAGRNFECYSEDPLLSARMAVAYITGVQSQGVACTVKHFVANDSEFERMTISSEVDDRTLREISLVPFEAAVKEAGTWALMTAYNRVNGPYCSEHAPLSRCCATSGSSTVWSCRTGSEPTARLPRRTPASTSRCPGRRSSSGRSSPRPCGRVKSRKPHSMTWRFACCN